MAKFLVRQVDAWADPDGGWTYNDVWNIGTLSTKASVGKGEKHALTAFLRKRGYIFKRGCIRICFDGDNYEIQNRKTGEPLFDAVYQSERFS